MGKIAFVAADKNIDKIIPLYINNSMPTWFVYVFMLTLLSAAMSTSSSQFHTMGTAVGRDLFERTLFRGRKASYTVPITRVGIVAAVLITVLLGYKLPGNVIAIATAIFFGLCANMFLPTYIGALFWKGMTTAGAIASILVGFLGSAFWLLFIHVKESEALGLCNLIFGKPSLAGLPWNTIDPIVAVLPVSFIVAIVVSLMTKKLPQAHLDACFKNV